MVRSGRNFNSSKILCMSSLHVSIKRIGPKAAEKRWRHRFPICKSMGAFCCHGHQSFYPICLKTLCSLSPPLVMLLIKLDQDWPTGLRDQVRKCKIFVIQGQVTPVSGLIRPKIKLVRTFMPVLVTSNFKMIRSKMKEVAWKQHFPIISLGKFFRRSRQLTP